MVSQLDRAIRQAKVKMQNAVLQEHSNMINRAIEQNSSNHIPHGYCKKLVQESALVCPWLTYDTMMNFHRKQKRLGRINDTPIFVGDTANETIAASTKRKNGGRPLGSSDKRKRENGISVVATTNEITIAFNSEKQAAFDNKKRMKKGRLTELINEIKSKNNIATSIKIQQNTIRRQSQRGGCILMELVAINHH